MKNRVEKPTIFQWSAYQYCVYAAVALVILAGTAVLYAYNPARSSLFPHCPFHALTGLHCPGCGTLRALHEMLHGHPAAAFGLNPLSMIFLPILGYVLLSRIVPRLRPRRPGGFSIGATRTWILVGVIAAFWILRNIPVYPFSLLAP